MYPSNGDKSNLYTPLVGRDELEELPTAVPNTPNIPGDNSASPVDAHKQPTQPPLVEQRPSPAPQTPRREPDPAHIILGLWLLGAGAVLV